MNSIADNKFITCERFLSYVSVRASLSPRSSSRSSVHCVSARSPFRSALITKSSVRISSTRRNVPSSSLMSTPRQKRRSGAHRSGDMGGSWNVKQELIRSLLYFCVHSRLHEVPLSSQESAFLSHLLHFALFFSLTSECIGTHVIPSHFGGGMTRHLLFPM